MEKKKGRQYKNLAKILLCLCLILVSYILWTYPEKWQLNVTPIVIPVAFRWPKDQSKPRSLACKDVLSSMLTGRWEKNHVVPQEEMRSLQSFLHTSRMQHYLPYELQRQDKLCGNVTFDELKGRMSDLMWFRALCDPDGETPCCYNNQCVDRSEDSCKCDDCYDLRQSINAEFATWYPLNPACKVLPFKNEADVCTALKNMTIYFIGDSFIRHLYISFLDVIRRDVYYGVLKKYTPPGLINGCNTQTHFSYLRMCMSYIDTDTWECNHSIKLKFMEYPRADQSNYTLKAVSELKGKKNSLVVLGIGLHDDFNVSKIDTKLLQPLFTQLSGSVWPRLLWSAMHAPGLLKTPRIPSQNKTSIFRYNAHIQKIMERMRVPVFNSFNLTDGTMSYDGAHYGKGVNDVKAQILLNYLMEFRTHINVLNNH